MAENKIESLKKNWQENTLTPLVKRFGERKPKFTTSAEDMIVETVYTPATDDDGSRGKARAAGRVPLYARCAAEHVPRPLLDDAPVRRLWQCQGKQRTLQVPHRAGTDRPLRRLRPAHADRLRRRPRVRRGRGRQGGRVDLQPARHADAARRHPARQGQHQHDDQRAGRRVAGDGDRGGQSRASPPNNCAARSRTTFSRNTSRAAPTSSRQRHRCG
jgi:hypothetical protein